MVVLVVLGNDFFLSLSSSFVSSLPLGRSVAPDGCEARARVRQGVVLVFLLLLKVDKDFCVLLLLFGNDVSSSATAGPIPVQRHHTHSTGPSFIPPEEEEEDAGTSTIPPPPPLLLPLTLWYIAWRLGHDGSFFSAVRSSSSSISKERKESRGCRYCRPIGPWWKWFLELSVNLSLSLHQHAPSSSCRSGRCLSNVLARLVNVEGAPSVSHASWSTGDECAPRPSFPKRRAQQSFFIFIFFYFSLHFRRENSWKRP